MERISDERIAEMVDTLQICADTLPCEMSCGELHALIERLRVAEEALLEASKDHINSEGTFGEAMRRLRKRSQWKQRAERELIAEGKIRGTK